MNNILWFCPLFSRLSQQHRTGTSGEEKSVSRTTRDEIRESSAGRSSTGSQAMRNQRDKNEDKENKSVARSKTLYAYITTSSHNHPRLSPRATRTARGSLPRHPEGLRTLARVAACLKKARSRAKARCRAVGLNASVEEGHWPHQRRTALLVDCKKVR